MHDILSSPRLRGPRALPWRAQLAAVAALAAIAIVALVAAPMLWRLFNAHEEIAAAPAVAPGTFRPTDAQWAGLKLAPVQQSVFRATRVTDGKIAVDDDTTTPVFSPYSGRVTKLFVKAGDTVNKGDSLLAVAASEFVQGQNDLVSAIAALNTARAQVRLTTISEKRQHDLYDAKAGALKDWEQAQADLESAKNNLRMAEITLAAVRNRLHILGEGDDQISALEGARQMNAEAVIAAPISGTVTQRQVGLGQYINSGASGAPNLLFAIGDMSTVWLVANVREADAPLMRVGEAVEVHVLAFPGRVFSAKISYVAPSVDPNTHRLMVRAEVDNADGALKPEMFARFSIITDKDSTAPSVPADAVVYEGETARVWIARDDKSLALRDIRVGRIEDGAVEVLAGLDPGETVVTSGSLFIDRAAKGD